MPAAILPVDAFQSSDTFGLGVDGLGQSIGLAGPPQPRAQRDHRHETGSERRRPQDDQNEGGLITPQQKPHADGLHILKRE